MKKSLLILTGIIFIGLFPGCQKQQRSLKYLQIKTDKIQTNPLTTHEYMSDKERIKAVSKLYFKEKWPLAVAFEDMKTAEGELKNILNSSKRREQSAQKKQSHELILQAKTLQNEAEKLQNNTQKIIQAIQKDPECKKQIHSLTKKRYLKRGVTTLGIASLYFITNAVLVLFVLPFH